MFRYSSASFQKSNTLKHWLRARCCEKPLRLNSVAVAEVACWPATAVE